MSGQQSYRTIQALRALACLLVVAYHGLDQWGRTIAPGQDSITLWPNGSAGVDLFFVISGFVMHTSSRRLAGRTDGWRIFIARRLQRIVPLYWAATLLKLGIALAAPGLTPTTRLNGWNIAATFLFIPSRDAAGLFRTVLPVGWTLNFEMLFYAIFALALALRIPALSLLLPVLSPLAAAGFFWTEDWPSLLFFANPLVLEFCLGVGLAVALPRLPRLSPWAAGIGLVLGCALLMFVIAPGPWRFAVWGGPAALMLWCALGLEHQARVLPGSVLAIGDASYAIYLDHLFLLPPIGSAARHLHLTGAVALAFIIALGLLASTVAGLAINHWIDAPLQARFKRRTEVAV